MPRKHLIASGINKKQQSQAKLFMKLASEIKASVKVGGSNLEANSRLKVAVERALENNMTKDSIQRNIDGIQKNKDLINEIDYEIYGPNGVGIIVSVITDNINRTIGTLRGYIAKLKGNLAKSNSVKTNFEKKGIILIKNNNLNEDILLNILIDFPIEDIINKQGHFEVILDQNNFYKELIEIKNVILKNNLSIIDTELNYIPIKFVDLNKNDFELLDKFLNSCDNDNDIQNVVTNFGEIKNE